MNTLDDAVTGRRRLYGDGRTIRCMYIPHLQPHQVPLSATLRYDYVDASSARYTVIEWQDRLYCTSPSCMFIG